MSCDYEGAFLASSCGNKVHLWKPDLCGSCETVVQKTAYRTVSCDRPVTSVAWNRNNKVVAIAGGDQQGTIELRYSNGEPMSVLPAPTERGASHDKGMSRIEGASRYGGRRVNGLCWSQGSKRLVASCDDGNILVHDLKEKICTPHRISSGSPILAAEYQPEDAYLAVVSDAITLHDAKTCEQIARLPRPRKGSCGYSDLAELTQEFTCMSTASRDKTIAAGSSSGLVAVWDCSTSKILWQHFDSRSGGLTATQFVPLEPSLLWTAGADGELILHDIRERGSLHKISSRISIGVPISALSVREASSHLAVGGTDGTAYLYDTRHRKSALAALRCNELNPEPVTSLHWQHNYQNVSRRMTMDSTTLFHSISEYNRDKCMESSQKTQTKWGGDLVSEQQSSRKFSSRWEKHGQDMDTVHMGNNVDENKKKAELIENELYLEPPKRLDLTPLPGARPRKEKNDSCMAEAIRAQRTNRNQDISGMNVEKHFNVPEKTSNHVIDPADALERFRRRQQGKSKTPEPPSKQEDDNSEASSSAVSIENAQSASDKILSKAALSTHPEKEVTRISEEICRSGSEINQGEIMVSKEKEVGEVSVERKNINDQDNADQREPWSIKVGSTPYCRELKSPAMRKNAEQNEKTASMQKTNLIMNDVEYSDQKVAATDRSPTMIDRIGGFDDTTKPLAESIRNDILALHLDMLNNFEQHREDMNKIVEGIRSRQDALASEIASLREQLSDLLTRRDGALWL